MSGIRTAALAALLACSALAGCRESLPAPCALYECDGACGHRVFPNQGGGSLGEPFFVPSATSRQLAAVDVQGDGRMDLVAATMETHAIEIRRQSAPGRYEGPDLLPIPADQVLFADLNGDGRDDLVTLVAAADAVPRGTIQVHLSGSKALVPLASLSGFGWGRVQAGDVDADGAIDLVVSSAAVPGVLLNRGDGTFRTEIPVLGMSSSALLADVTGDGIPDLVDRSRYGLQVAIGLGNGAFSSPVETPTSTTLSGYFATGDVNGDGRDDAVVLDSSGSAIHVLPGRSEGTFGPAVNLSFEIPADWFSDSGLVVGDLDGDGRAEIAGLVSWYEGAAPRDHSALVIARDPLTSPSPVELIPLTGSRDAVAIGSVAGRGAADLVVAGRGSLGVFPTREGSSAFSPEERWSMPEKPGLKLVPVVGDLDGDLRADIVFPVRDHLVVFPGACLRT